MRKDVCARYERQLDATTKLRKRYVLVSQYHDQSTCFMSTTALCIVGYLPDIARYFSKLGSGRITYRTLASRLPSLDFIYTLPPFPFVPIGCLPDFTQ